MAASVDPLLHSLERADASLAIVRQRLEVSLGSSFTGADAKLSPGR